MQPSIWNALEKPLAWSICFQNGIIPIDSVAGDMRKVLKKLSPEDERIAKRKFRKQWRKLAKKKTKRNKFESKNRAPTTRQQHERKLMVVQDVSRKIQDIVARLPQPGR